MKGDEVGIDSSEEEIVRLAVHYDGKQQATRKDSLKTTNLEELLEDLESTRARLNHVSTSYGEEQRTLDTPETRNRKGWLWWWWKSWLPSRRKSIPQLLTGSRVFSGWTVIGLLLSILVICVLLGVVFSAQLKVKNPAPVERSGWLDNLNPFTDHPSTLTAALMDRHRVIVPPEEGSIPGGPSLVLLKKPAVDVFADYIALTFRRCRKQRRVSTEVPGAPGTPTDDTVLTPDDIYAFEGDLPGEGFYDVYDCSLLSTRDTIFYVDETETARRSPLRLQEERREIFKKITNNQFSDLQVRRRKLVESTLIRPADPTLDLSPFFVDPFLPRTTSAERRLQAQLIDDWARLALAFKTLWMVDFGHSLGSLRHGDVVPWDDDIDVSVGLADFVKLVGAFHSPHYDPDMLQRYTTYCERNNVTSVFDSPNLEEKSYERFDSLVMGRMWWQRNRNAVSSHVKDKVLIPLFHRADFRISYRFGEEDACGKMFFRDSHWNGKYPWTWPFLDIFCKVYNKDMTWWRGIGIMEDTVEPLTGLFPLQSRPLGELVMGPFSPATLARISLYESKKGSALDVCSLKGWSHRDERGYVFGRGTVPCKSMHDVYPFIRHRGAVQVPRDLIPPWLLDPSFQVSFLREVSPESKKTHEDLRGIVREFGLPDLDWIFGVGVNEYFEGSPQFRISGSLIDSYVAGKETEFWATQRKQTENLNKYSLIDPPSKPLPWTKEEIEALVTTSTTSTSTTSTSTTVAPLTIRDTATVEATVVEITTAETTTAEITTAETTTSPVLEGEADSTIIAPIEEGSQNDASDAPNRDLFLQDSMCDEQPPPLPAKELFGWYRSNKALYSSAAELKLSTGETYNPIASGELKARSSFRNETDAAAARERYKIEALKPFELDDLASSRIDKLIVCALRRTYASLPADIRHGLIGRRLSQFKCVTSPCESYQVQNSSSEAVHRRLSDVFGEVDSAQNFIRRRPEVSQITPARKLDEEFLSPSTTTFSSPVSPADVLEGSTDNAEFGSYDINATLLDEIDSETALQLDYEDQYIGGSLISRRFFLRRGDRSS